MQSALSVSKTEEINYHWITLLVLPITINTSWNLDVRLPGLFCVRLKLYFRSKFLLGLVRTVMLAYFLVCYIYVWNVNFCVIFVEKGFYPFGKSTLPFNLWEFTKICHLTFGLKLHMSHTFPSLFSDAFNFTDRRTAT